MYDLMNIGHAIFCVFSFGRCVNTYEHKCLILVPIVNYLSFCVCVCVWFFFFIFLYPLVSFQKTEDLDITKLVPPL